MSKKDRSRFWVVSTHVLTSGFAMPILATLAGMGAIQWLEVQGAPALLMGLGILAIGYIGGTYYSLSYLRKEARVENWSTCTKHAVACFAVLAILAFGRNVYSLASKDFMAISILGILYILIVVAFGVITRRGFAKLDHQENANYSGLDLREKRPAV